MVNNEFFVKFLDVLFKFEIENIEINFCNNEYYKIF